MGPTHCRRRRFARCRWGHTVRPGYQAARRDHSAGGRLERYSELRVGGAAGNPTWVIRYRSRELIWLKHLGVPALLQEVAVSASLRLTLAFSGPATGHR